MKRLVLDFEHDYELNQLLDNAGVDEKGNRVLHSLRNGNANSVKAIVVKEEYKVIDLETKLQRLKDALDTLKRAGFTMNLLERYVRTKGVSKREFDAVMSGIKEFFYEID